MLDTRVLTQYLLGRKIIPLKELYALLEEDINSEDVGSVLDQIRNVLVPFHIDLRRAFDNNGDEVLILFDHMNDEISRMGCPFSKEQLVAFKAIVDLIATNPKRYASTMELLNKLADLLQYSKREFESLVTSLVDGKWLEQTLNGKLRLGMRSEIELAEYLKAEFSFDECCVCKRIVASQVRHVFRLPQL